MNSKDERRLSRFQYNIVFTNQISLLWCVDWDFRADSMRKNSILKTDQEIINAGTINNSVVKKKIISQFTRIIELIWWKSSLRIGHEIVLHTPRNPATHLNPVHWLTTILIENPNWWQSRLEHCKLLICMQISDDFSTLWGLLLMMNLFPWWKFVDFRV